jgi:crossover junction endodeoxyribonuclease RuvC
MRILGIDPGLATIGFALITKTKNQIQLENLGVITTSKDLPLQLRLFEIHQELEKLIKETKPDLLNIEKLVFVKNVTNGLQVAHSRGIVLFLAAKWGLKTTEISAKDVKINICGFGNAPKVQVQRMVQKIFKLKQMPKPDDAADALAIAYSAVYNT